MNDSDRVEPLFSSQHLSELLDARMASALASVDAIDSNEILQRPPEQVIDELFHDYRVPSTKLDRDGRVGKLDETKVDVRGDFSRAIYDTSRPVLVPATRIEYRVPFIGPNLFGHRPNRYSLGPPRARIEGSNVVVSCSIPNDVLEKQRQPAIDELNREIDKIEEHLSWISNDLDKWEPQLRRAIESRVQKRRSDLLMMLDTASMLGVPIIRDDAVAKTLAVPVPRRRPAPRPQTGSAYESFTPEPSISEEDFEKIVTDIGSVLAGFERFPIAHANASEEHLRDQIVVSLNAIYGGGSAESFSKKGKTDIYLPWENNAVFLAECKWWHGQKKFRDEALPQLLNRYIVWRDTHTAIVLFIKNKDVSAIISKATNSIREHPRFVKDASSISSFPTFILHQDGDEDRWLKLALLTAAIIP